MKSTKLSMKAQNSTFLAAWEVRAVKSWKCLGETPDDTKSSLSSKATCGAVLIYSLSAQFLTTPI